MRTHRLVVLAIASAAAASCNSYDRNLYGRLLDGSGDTLDVAADSPSETSSDSPTTDAPDVADATADAPGCDAGGTLCGGACVDTTTDPNHCGACGHTCAGTADGDAACSASTCTIQCHAGFSLAADGTCTIAAPRPLAPMSVTTTTTRHPVFRWQLAPGTDGAEIVLCADRACATTIARSTVSASTFTPTSDLAAGTVYWKLYGTIGARHGTAASPTWEFRVGARNASVNTTWGASLDIDGDGFDDTVVSAPNAGVGQVHVFAGSTSGVRPDPTLTLVGPGSVVSRFGSSLDGASDVNGDGFADLVVGAPSSAGGGLAHVYFGSAAGLPTTPSADILPPGPSSRFGTAVAGAGDVNGDGYGDVVIADDGYNSDAGRAYVYAGGPSGLVRAPIATLDNPLGAGVFYGNAVAGAGDVNGDGYSDIVVGTYDATATGSGSAFVYQGSATGIPAVPSRTLLGPDGVGGHFGTRVELGGDFDGDGYSDLVVGAYGVRSDEGAVYVFSGSPTGIASTPTLTLRSPATGSVVFGSGLCARGDLDGNGYADLVVGADGAASYAGRVYVFAGGTSGIPAMPTRTISGPTAMFSFFGSDVSAGDVDGDHLADLVIAGYQTARTTTSAWVYFGLSTTAPVQLVPPMTGRDGFGAATGL